MGPQEIPKIKKEKGQIKGVVVPHAGYRYSGYVAAYAYNEIAKDGFPKKFIILGPNHQGIGKAVSLIKKGKWKTPLGNVNISEDAEKYAIGVIKNDELAHKYEHSIEVQIPFLQFLSDDFEFTPICMNLQDWETASEIGKKLSQAQDTIIIASSDFSHVGFSGFPSDDDIEEQVKKKDMIAIEEILNMNSKGLVEKVREHNITMCGYGAVAAMIEAVKAKTTEVKLLKYATSYDVEPGTYCVGYAAIVFK